MLLLVSSKESVVKNDFFSGRYVKFGINVAGNIFVVLLLLVWRWGKFGCMLIFFDWIASGIWWKS